MVGMDRQRSGGIAPIIGALTAGRRPLDPLVRAGFAGAVVAALLHLWHSSLEEERILRGEQHRESVKVMERVGAAIDRLATNAESERVAATELRAEIIRTVQARTVPLAVPYRTHPNSPTRSPSPMVRDNE